MEKVDFKKSLDCYKAKQGEFRIIKVPKMHYLMIDGHGDPNTSKDFANGVQTLFPLAYKLKFMSKQDIGRDYAVMPLEGLWWSEDMNSYTTSKDKSQWDFTLMIMQPDWITTEMFEQAKEKVAYKVSPEILAKVRFETLDEGLSVQTLHIGSFDDETAVLDKMHNDFMASSKLKYNGKHHEIYFSDFRKVAPEKLKTILRQPVVEI